MSVTQPPATDPEPPRSAARQWGIPLAVVGAIVAAVIVGGMMSSDGNTPSRSGAAEAAPVADSTVTVLYEVEGSTDYADVTMETPTGTSQISPDVPMARKSDGQPGLVMEFETGDFLYLSAQNKRGYGTVTCRISVDGVVVTENSASGGYAIASCKGIA